ncbi:MAG: ORF6N domain-containing protein [Thermoanaerobaculia bacterium]
MAWQQERNELRVEGRCSRGNHLNLRSSRYAGQSVMLDTDLASAYGVLTKALNQAVRRNPVASRPISGFS